MIVGSMAGALSAAGGFCAGSDEIVEHQRICAASYTFSAALPAMSAVAASEVVGLLQSSPSAADGSGGMGMVGNLRENIRTMWSCIDPRSEWVRCTSNEANPIMILVLKDEVVRARRWTRLDIETVLQEVVDEVCFLPLRPPEFLRESHQHLPPSHPSNTPTNPQINQCLNQSILITRQKTLSAEPSGGNPKKTADVYSPPPALKVCLTTGLTKKEVEKAGVAIRHAIAKVLGRKKF